MANLVPAFAGIGSTSQNEIKSALTVLSFISRTVTAPASATFGTTGTIGLTTSGLAPATKYLGSVAYGGAAGLPAPTLVRLDTP